MDPIDNILNSLQNNVRQVETLSQNIANANTPGYLGQQVFSVNSGDGVGELITTHNTPSESALKNTGRSLDIALLNQGFLLVEKEGEVLITRNGRLHIDGNGFLNHASGARVLGQNGPIELPNGSVEINKQGIVHVDGEALDTLSTATAADTHSLIAEGYGLYRSAKQLLPIENAIQQGAINDASVQVSTDMVRMIELSRHTQSLQKAVQAIDQIANAGINELGKR